MGPARPRASTDHSSARPAPSSGQQRSPPSPRQRVMVATLRLLAMAERGDDLDGTKGTPGRGPPGVRSQRAPARTPARRTAARIGRERAALESRERSNKAVRDRLVRSRRSGRVLANRGLEVQNDSRLCVSRAPSADAPSAPSVTSLRPRVTAALTAEPTARLRGNPTAELCRETHQRAASLDWAAHRTSGVSHHTHPQPHTRPAPKPRGRGVPYLAGDETRPTNAERDYPMIATSRYDVGRLVSRSCGPRCPPCDRPRSVAHGRRNPHPMHGAMRQLSLQNDDTKKLLQSEAQATHSIRSQARPSIELRMGHAAPQLPRVRKPHANGN
jgi:hypothetical protein